MTKDIKKAIRTVRNFNEESVQPLFLIVMFLIVLVCVTAAVFITMWLTE